MRRHTGRNELVLDVLHQLFGVAHLGHNVMEELLHVCHAIMQLTHQLERFHVLHELAICLRAFRTVANEIGFPPVEFLPNDLLISNPSLVNNVLRLGFHIFKELIDVPGIIDRMLPSYDIPQMFENRILRCS